MGVARVAKVRCRLPLRSGTEPRPPHVTIKRGPWPSSLRTWACPEPSPPDRAIEFWRALIMFLQDPAAPPVGDRLRDSHKIQAIQAAPT
ncbi:hypothetical protein MRX96_012775 [Rhipicephalus microplus]